MSPFYLGWVIVQRTNELHITDVRNSALSPRFSFYVAYETRDYYFIKPILILNASFAIPHRT